MPTRRIMWIGLNPSTADEQKLDPTLRRVKSFSQAWGFNAFVMTNLFAFRATDPADMKAVAVPEGTKNDDWLLSVANVSELIIACWGVHGVFRNRAESVAAMFQGRLYCIGVTKDGHPKHPLYVAGGTPFQRYGF